MGDLRAEEERVARGRPNGHPGALAGADDETFGLDLEVDETIRVDCPDDDLDRRVAAVVDVDLVAPGPAAARCRRHDLGACVGERPERDPAFLDRDAGRIGLGLDPDTEWERAGPRERLPRRRERDLSLAFLAREQRQRDGIDLCPLRERPDDGENEPVDDRALVPDADGERYLCTGVHGEVGGVERCDDGHGRESTATGYTPIVSAIAQRGGQS